MGKAWHQSQAQTPELWECVRTEDGFLDFIFFPGPNPVLLLVLMCCVGSQAGVELAAILLPPLLAGLHT